MTVSVPALHVSAFGVCDSWAFTVQSTGTQDGEKILCDASSPMGTLLRYGGGWERRQGAESSEEMRAFALPALCIWQSWTDKLPVPVGKEEQDGPHRAYQTTS